MTLEATAAVTTTATDSATDSVMDPAANPATPTGSDGAGAAGPAGTGMAGTGPAGTGMGTAAGRRGAADEAGTAAHRPSLSPSRAADFKTCPLLYRYRSIDRLPERPTPDQLRGTLVHAVLERLFDLPAEQRTPERAAELVSPQWQRMVEEHPELLDVFADTAPPDTAPGDTAPVGTAPVGTAPVGTAAAGTAPAPAASSVEVPVAEATADGGPDRPVGPRAVAMTTDELVGSATELLGGYFAVEDPRRLAPAERECLVSVEVDDGRLLLRGYIDRLDESPAGDLRVVDYKTGGAPREAFEARALFQLKFYALVLWRLRGVAPKVLRLLYLKDAEICDYSPETEELDRFERTLVALWAAIEKATAERDFRPKPSRLCGWCAHQAVCPAFGGTPPPFPESVPPPQVEPAVLLDE